MGIGTCSDSRPSPQSMLLTDFGDRTAGAKLHQHHFALTYHIIWSKMKNNLKRSDYEWFIKTEGKPVIFEGQYYGEKYTFDTIRALSWISDASFVKDFLDKIDNAPMFKFACETFLTQYKLRSVFNDETDDFADKPR